MSDSPVTKPFGWRARLGVIIPTVNTIAEPEFNVMAPEGVTCHFARMPFHIDPGKDGFKEQLSDLEASLADLATCGSTVVAYNCTYGSMTCPAELLKPKLESVPGRPSVTTAAAALDALAVLGVKRISMATPYHQAFNDHEKHYLEAAGVEVVVIEGMDFDDYSLGGLNYASVPPAEVLAHARTVDRPEAEAIFISCANFGSAGIVQTLEKEIGKPVITSNICTLWAGLRAAGIADQIEGFGTLLAEY